MADYETQPFILPIISKHMLGNWSHNQMLGNIWLISVLKQFTNLDYLCMDFDTKNLLLQQLQIFNVEPSKSWIWFNKIPTNIPRTKTPSFKPKNLLVFKPWAFRKIRQMQPKWQFPSHILQVAASACQQLKRGVFWGVHVARTIGDFVKGYKIYIFMILYVHLNVSVYVYANILGPV